jgi:FlaA1/EpsC-like NDP-sugar epimerase
MLIGFGDSAVLAAVLALTIGLVAGTDNLDPAIWLLFPLTVIAGLVVLASQGLYKAIIRFIGSEMILGIIRAMIVLAAVVGLAAYFLFGRHLALTAALVTMFWALSTVALSSGRMLMRALVSLRPGTQERVIIYGAGQAGARLAAIVKSGREFLPVALVDDDLKLHGRLVAGLPVCAPDALPVLVAELNVRRVLMALPSVRRPVRQEIINRLASLPVRVQTMPDIGDLVSGKARVDELRDVDAMDLLGRDPVPPSELLVSRTIAGNVVMVTGAGGSIGSELCRQIIALRPSRLVLFERSEVALYGIDQELRELTKARRLDVEIIALLGSVTDRERVLTALRTFGVHTLYHAAAYKHVPIVEYNMLEGVQNNVMGTWHIAEAAEQAGVRNVVLISTDKAVSPTNVMGATKRMAELVLQAMTERNSPTRFCMVRFGNVLESSGSVVPLFREQIRRGGPVTVTHRDVIRYFMTIPEAAQLVLQAASMARGGDVFVLDMGQPVRIDDLARRMIRLMGLTIRDETHPGGDIAIEYTGLRPAEKLYEELLIGSNVSGTEHPMIMRAVEKMLPWSRVEQCIRELEAAIGQGDCARARDLLREAIPEYAPLNGVEDLVWEYSRPLVSTGDDKVTELRAHRR